ncbi:hypothetical protein [Caballeronia sp. KNU42]
MRYYAITLVNPATSQVLVPNPGSYGTAFTFSDDQSAVTFSSLNAGANPYTLGGSNPAALRCELDITSTPLHSPDAHAKPFVRIHGVPLAMVAQAADLNGMFISVIGGMSRGLPLASPQQSGLLAAGQVLQAVGEWVNTDQSLTLYLAPGGSSADYSNASGSASAMQPVTGNTPANLIFSWSAGQSMAAAITDTLQTAFPQVSIKMAISNALMWASAVPKTAYFQDLHQFAVFVNQTSKSVIAGPNPASTVYAQSTNPTYQGVTIVLEGGTLVVQDFSTQTEPIEISFQDLVGQPNWSAPGKVQAVTAMRGDITTGSFVKLPSSLGTTGAFGSPNGGASPLVIGNASNSPYKGNSAFQGTALVTKTRHLGDSRSPSGLSWISSYELAFAQPTTSPLLSSVPYVYKSTSGNSFGFTNGSAS